MSYNIDSISILKKKNFKIDIDKFNALSAQYGDCHLPEQHPFVDPDFVLDDDGNVLNWVWIGAGSGSTFENMLKLLAEFDGEADLLCVWEGGESLEGVRLKDHKVTVHEVEHVLGKQVNVR